MTDDEKAQRFPIGLTIVTAIALAILIALGVWQLQRLKWKEGLLAHVAALQTARPQPLGPVLDAVAQPSHDARRPVSDVPVLRRVGAASPVARQLH